MIEPDLRDQQLIKSVVILTLAALSVGLFAMWGVPKLWQWLKPFFN